MRTVRAALCFFSLFAAFKNVGSSNSPFAGSKLYRAPSNTRVINFRLPRLLAPTRLLQSLHLKASANDMLLGSLGAAYALQMTVPRSTLALMKMNEQLARSRRQWYRLGTCIFVHASVPHLVANGASLANIGPACEQWMGRERFLGTFLASGIASSVASWRFTREPSLGASGAIYGLLGAWTCFLLENRHLLGDAQAYRGVVALGKTIGINLVIAGGANFGRIDHAGHAGGLVSGASVGVMFGPRLRVVKLHPADTTYLGKSFALVDHPRLPSACRGLAHSVERRIGALLKPRARMNEKREVNQVPTSSRTV